MTKLLISTNTIPEEWDETTYLCNNPDVAKAIQLGIFSSGYDHFKKHGYYEKRSAASHKQNVVSQKFHFIEDYRNLVRNLMEQYPLDEAMSRAIGGNFVAWGQIERQLLIHFGLLPNHTLIDIGCGSGRLAKAMIPYLKNGTYLGTDIVDELLDYAKKDCPFNWQFQNVENISIPYPSKCADFCVFFSVFTHLLPEEIYCYLIEAQRVIKDSGMIIFSFLEYSQNWDVFEATYSNILSGKPNVHLNTFIGRDAIECWADRLGLSIVSITAGNKPFILLPQPVTLDDGRVIEGLQAFGQSVCALKKSSAATFPKAISPIATPPKFVSHEVTKIPAIPVSLAEQLPIVNAQDAAFLYVFKSGEASTIPEDMIYLSHVGKNGEAGYITLANGNPKAVSSGATGGYSIRLPHQIETAASGHRITVSVIARAASRDQSSFAVAYSTNEVGNSGWRWFNAGPEWSIYTMEYNVPVMKEGRGDFVGILPDREGNPGTEFYCLAITIS